MPNFPNGGPDSLQQKTISEGIFKWSVLGSVSESHKQKLAIVW